MGSASDTPAMAEHNTNDAQAMVSNEKALKRNFEFVHTHSIADNFGNMIAQTDPKPSKSRKTKSKKRPRKSGAINTMMLDGPQAAPPFIQPYPSHTVRTSPFTAIQLSPPQMGPMHQNMPKWSYPSNVNLSQVQQSAVAQAPPTRAEPMNDAASEDMDVSSGSDAEIPVESHQSHGPSFGSMPKTPASVNKPEHLRRSGSEAATPLKNRQLHGASFKVVEETPVDDNNNENQKSDDLSDWMELSSGPEIYSDDESAVSQRVSTMTFNDSGPSSHTSTNLSNGLRTSTQGLSEMHRMSLSPTRSDYSSQLSPAKSTTPVMPKPSNEPHLVRSRPRVANRRSKDFDSSDQRPSNSVLDNLPDYVLAQECNEAAFSSRLNPYALHHDEYKLLREHISHSDVTAYLNIRNRILRLWVKNPLVQVTAEEAAKCAQSVKWLGQTKVAYEWLVRRGYINFGCVEIQTSPDLKVKTPKLKRKQKTIAIIGAGMAGLGCARQLGGLIRHYEEKWMSLGEDLPKVVLLEGRNRIGGRIYSHPLQNQHSQDIEENSRCTAELGAHIIIGFDNGNPLSMIVRGQLALHFHMLKDNSTLHDIDGKAVDRFQDRKVEELYNDCLDRASAYRHKMDHALTVEGDQFLIDHAQYPHQKGVRTIADVERDTPDIATAYSTVDKENVPDGMDRLTGKAYMVSGPRKKQAPAAIAKKMGWDLGENILSYDDLNLDAVAKASKYPTLGAVMDEAVKQYQFLLDLTPKDMRLINWHYANLEYANAANVGKLSLGGWDQDAGNEFSGGHTQVIGGYQQVPDAILQSPYELDVRTDTVVKRIEYNVWSGNSKTPRAKVHCDNGEIYDADHVVLTTPLGVLKDRAIEFSPSLPGWKLGPIDRLGYGILNKCILVYDYPFWDINQDMFGLLRDSEVKDSLDQEDYTTNRGRFYFFWNCIKTSGRPVLISLMAGDAAYQAERLPDAHLVAEVTHELAKIFKDTKVPLPQESIITRWGQDPFARGTYSYVGAKAIPGDYEAMAQPVGNLHFAGEATCASHPATVHGAYISGLRAASDIIEDLLGPIEVSNLLFASSPSVQEGKTQQQTPLERPLSDSQKPRTSTSTLIENANARKARLDAFETEIIDTIHMYLGLRPALPKGSRSNAFLLYSSENWASTKDFLAHRSIGSGRNDIRSQLGMQWNALPEYEKRPYKDKASAAKITGQIDALTYDARAREWDVKAFDLRRKYIASHPGELTAEEEKTMWEQLYRQYGEAGAVERAAKLASGYAYPQSEVPSWS